MNTKLVQSLAQIITSLSVEERILLDVELKGQNNWENDIEKIEKHRQAIYKKKNISLVSVDDIFEKMRTERSQQLL